MIFKNDHHQEVNDVPKEIIEIAFRKIDSYLQKYLDESFINLVHSRQSKAYQLYAAEIFVLRQLNAALKECQKD